MTNKANNFKGKIVFSLYKGHLLDKKVVAGLFNDSGKILDLFESISFKFSTINSWKKH